MKPNKKLESLYRKDQNHIRKWEKHYSKEEFYSLNKKLRKELKKLKLKTGRDYFIAAMILHHGFKLSTSKEALRMIEKAQDLGYKKQKWVKASIIDRLLQMQKKPQKFGTQWYQIKSGEWKFYKVNPKTSDKEREEWGLPSLKILKSA